MKITLSDKIIAYMALLSGLTISAVAVWYSVAGLVSIFAAAVTPIIVMGVALEISKLIATVWLKLNWQRAPFFIKAYMSAAVAVLMIITSMGIFGFLSKAHSDQSLVSGDVQSRIAVYDEKIKTAKENIDANRKALKQMDEAVDQSMARSTSETGADKAVAIRRGQAKERARLQNEIAAEQKTINKLSEERAPIAAEVRKVEAEVGPIKYIAAFVYGDNPDANVLEKAVTWVIIIIVSVFDPLAVILLLASQYSFQWFRKAREEEESDEKEIKEWFEQGKERARQLDAEAANTAKFEDIEDPIVDEIGKPAPEPEIDYSKHTYLNPEKSFWHKPEGWPEVPPQVYKPEPVQELAVEEVIDDDHEELVDESSEMKAAKAAWKHDHPNDSLKRHRKLFEQGIITQLPWESYLKDDAAIEAAKWAEENPQIEEAQEAKVWAEEHVRDLERPGDYITPPDADTPVTTWIERDGDKQITKTLVDDGYIQNAEQNSNTIWNRVKKAKGE